ncbi:MAG: sialate O-acetylesterase [Planctomycetota bacterium]
MPKRFYLHPLIALVVTALLPFHAAASSGKPVKVFILSGQSNMEGKASATTLEAVLNNPEHEHRGVIKHLKQDGQWVERDDVFVTYLDRKATELSPSHGPLSVGFGSLMKLKDENGRWHNHPGVGPELGIGWVLGEHFDEPVLLIKAAWGGRSVNHTFRPPSAMPSEADLQAHLERRKTKNPDATLGELRASYGEDYRKVLSEVTRVLDDIDQYVPGYDEAAGFEIAGFVWFQGWNDMVSGGNPAYTEQLAHLIRDMRRDLHAPGLPFVIGELGHKGVDAGGGYERFRRWQRAVVAMDEFTGTVAYAETAKYWPTHLDTSEEYRAFGKLAGANKRKPLDDPTRVDPAEFVRVNWTEKHAHIMPYRSDRPFHYMGSGLCYYRMGESMGRAMVGLIDGRD